MTRRALPLLFALLLCTTVPPAPAHADLGPDDFTSFESVSSRRVSRTVTEFEYRASVTITLGSARNVTAVVSSTSPNTTIVAGDLSFGDLPTPGSYDSLDTFSFRQDRRFPFDPAVLVFDVAFDNTPPVADAGPDQTVDLDATVQLDGSGSTDADGHPLTFDWQLVEAPDGSSAALDDETAIQPGFEADLPGRYVVELVVNDGFDDSAADDVIVDTANSLPTADAGPDQTVFLTDDVQLDGSGSTDPDGDLLTYEWQLVSVPQGSTATLSNPGAVMPRFSVDLAGTYEAELVVRDAEGASAPDRVLVDTENSAPVADPGAGQTVRVGETALLDGSGSSDVDGDLLTHLWSLTTPAGSGAILDDATVVDPSFLVDVPGTYVAQLIVNDGELDSPPRNVTVVTENSPPIASAGADQVVGFGLVTLDGSGSRDVDGDPLGYRWSLLSVPDGSGASLSGDDTAMPSFTADVDGSYVAQLIVDDGVLDSAPDTVLVRVDPLPVITGFFPAQLGASLQVNGSGTLGVAPVADVTVHIESSDPAVALIAADGSVPGSGALDVVVPGGSRSVAYVVQAVATGPFEVTLSAPGYTSFTRGGSVVASAAALNNLPSQLSTGGRDTFTIFLGVPNASGTGIASFQGPSAAAPPLVLTLTSSDPAVGDLTLDGSTGGSVSRTLAPGENQVLANFDARSPGITTVSATAPGLVPIAASSQQVLVDAPDLTAFSRTIGAGLQFSSTATLSIADHGGVTVRIESDDPGVALVAPDGTTPGAESIDVFVADGDASFAYTVQGVGGVVGSTSVTTSAAGFDPGVGTINVAAPGILLSALSATLTVGVNDSFSLLLGVANAAGTALSSFQRVSAANDLELTVTSSVPAVGDISFGGVTGGSVTRTLTAGEFQFGPILRALSAGTTNVSASIPGFLLVPGAASVEVVAPAP